MKTVKSAASSMYSLMGKTFVSKKAPKRPSRTVSRFRSSRRSPAVFANFVPKKQVELIFPTQLIKEPVIYKMAKAIDVVFNIRRAKVTTRTGEIVLELETKDDATMAKAVEFLTAQGIQVEPITHSTLES